jgi:hypothetical protein
MNRLLVSACAVSFLLAALMLAAAQSPNNSKQQPTPKPGEQKTEAPTKQLPQPKEQPLQAILEDLCGTVDVKLASGQDFAEGKKGMKLPEGTEIWTGYASEAIIAFADNTRILMRAVSNIVINKLTKSKMAVKGEVKMQIGSIKVEVKKTELKADLKVSTPNTTASVTGTEIREISTYPDTGDRYQLADGTILIWGRRGRWLRLHAPGGTDHTLRNPGTLRLEEESIRPYMFGMDLEEEEQMLYGQEDYLSDPSLSSTEESILESSRDEQAAEGSALPEPPAPPEYVPMQ